MKFGYAIVLALVALVAVSGFASADRLPQQVPENQIFTISTLIDVTGAVSESSQMQWTIISGDVEVAGAILDDEVATAVEDADLEALIDFADYLVGKYGGVRGDYLKYDTATNANPIYKFYYPDAEKNTILSFPVMGGMTASEYATSLLSPASSPYTTGSAVIYASIENSALKVGQEIALLTGTDSLRTNGGKLSLNKNIDFDSRNKGNGLYNLEVEKVLTYNSVEGAHLIGGEEWILDVAGNYEKSADSIRCVFAAAESTYFPAFCNVVKAKSELININSAQISTKGQARAVAATGDIPAALNYQIAVTPDANTGSGFADGTVKTLFGGAIMEARGNSLRPAATNNWKDEASVTGGIKNFQKVFTYESGFTF